MKCPAVRCVLLFAVAIIAGCGASVKRESARSKLSDAKSEYRFEDGAAADFNTENYNHIMENDFVNALQSPLSTFSIDVDTASYSNVRRFLSQGQLPPAGAVRIEELINYFRYDYVAPTDEHPFAVHVDYALCPWNAKHHVARIALQGKKLEFEDRNPSNLVFLLDFSGSMQSANKLQLVKSAMRMLVEQLGENDRIAIVVYAGASGLVLPSTHAIEQLTILAALEQLSAGGSTNGGEGIQLAYRVAMQNFIPGGINRVILCTDGDFNVGVTNNSDLVEMIQTNAKSNVFLSVFGFGTGNLNDSMMEELSGHGNGNYAYIDTLNEAKKQLIDQVEGTMVTIAKDVKIQVDFNPQLVDEYRLIGYENRMMASRDFDDDAKDAGEIGAGHCVTALYEIIPTGTEQGAPKVNPSKYVEQRTTPEGSNELLTVRLRYKLPTENKSTEFRQPLQLPEYVLHPSGEFAFVCAVAEFGMKLRKSNFIPNRSWDVIHENATNNLGTDRYGYRAEFVRLIAMAQQHASVAWRN